ncbi:hypothetical protein D9623_20060 [Azospirillum brasilense]|uniref:DUF4136 domain-containing protein n=1 Tax=Azospirillum brasilense TaxID=192 RepID=A0A0P0EEY7_AZOBR|nr:MULTISPECIES: hypothetical protein [Azospirillum]ALJ37607.1 hypothetical protein AMK58_19405 [Azospirillum brasilense]MDW7553816.1 hypothetical protein [Azospirillum brasilense]MDW7592745.1 hypothetical protein [Azospirillum brasilense]MDW7628276.1 hypothetical protein [Azospirillum brasilense]MDX5952215.1 hypothetical protein [Azospirillum brasilense]
MRGTMSGSGFVAVLLTTGLLGGCANPAADQAMVAQNALIGMPKQTLLSCAGVPERQTTAGDLEFFTYRSNRLYSYPSWGGYGGYWGYPYGAWGGYGYDVRSVDCDATFTLRNGAVERIVYGGSSSGGSRLGQCYAIVQNCLSQVPSQSPQPSMAPAR